MLTVNVALLGSYTLGCHSFRHLVGGVFDRIAERPVRKAAFSDLYVRLCSMGIWTDWRLI